MQLTRTVLSSLALLAMATSSPVAWAVVNPAQAPADTGFSIGVPLKLDAHTLMAMHTGEKIAIDFPVIGLKTVIFEATTQGLDGSRYWHGKLEGSGHDRVYLKQQKNGFVGAVRFGGKQVALKQQPDLSLQASNDVAPISGQAYVVGTRSDKGIYNIAGHFAGLTQAEVGAEIALPLPDGQVEVAIVTSSHIDQDGLVQIHSVSRMDGAGAPSVITVGKDAVFGTVISNGGEYQIITRRGKTQLVDPKAAGWAQLRGDDQAELAEASDSTEPLTQAVGAAFVSAATSKAPAVAAPLSGANLVPLKAGTIDTTITLLMTYSASYVAQWGTEALARTRLSNIVQVANSAYANSGTGIAFRIVGWSLIRQADVTPQVALPAMRGDSGAFKGIGALKRATGAAITVFFAPFNAVTGKTSTCGLAYIPGANSAGLGTFKAQVGSSMFTALNDGQSNGYYCETLSLAHELGHNLGNVHDKANSSFKGVFGYSYGKGVSGQFGTVMSYISPRVALFSSPQLACGSSQKPCGTSTENVVATMLQTKAMVAAQGISSKAAATSDSGHIVSGWLVNANGTPYTGVAVVKPSNAKILCQTGTTGLYVCKVPTDISSVNISVTAPGKVAAPSVGSFSVNTSANTPVNGTRFYLSNK
ncbi:MAG: M12 family metallo-peptidase [Aquabacterium sp.]|nr:M12 family metallo-peptidase [Aquabacterium sp.]